MRNVLLAGSVDYPSAAADYLAVPDGAIAIFNKGALLATPTGINDPVLDQPIQLVLGRSVDKGGPVSIEVDVHTLDIVKGEYVAATTFKSSVTIPSPVVDKDYTIVIMKKGIQFNERATWTVTHKVKSGDTADTIAAALTKSINFNTVGHGCKAAASTAKITITAEKAGVDYVVVPSDDLTGTAVDDYTAGIAGYGDAKYVEHLLSEGASDKGFEYTYRDGDTIYPNYPEKVSDNSFTIYTLTFGTTRAGAKVRDERVKQIVQLCIPTGAAQIAKLDKIFALQRK